MDFSQTLSVVIRSSSPSRLPFLDQALFSLLTQDWLHLEVLIVLQSPSEEFRQGVSDLVAMFDWPETMAVRVLNESVEEGVDGRARLLNAGIRASQGRYLAFLDDDDVVYTRGYTDLIGRLMANERDALAAGRCRMAHVREIEGHAFILAKMPGDYDWGRSKFDLFQENFIPIHSYVIDKSRCRIEDVPFRDAAVPLEDYDFLYRFANGNRFNFENRGRYVCEYRLHAGNTIWSNFAAPPTVPEKLRRAREFVIRGREAAVMSIDFQEWRGLSEQGAAAPSPAPSPEPRRWRSLHRLADRIYVVLDAVKEQLRAARRRFRPKAWRSDRSI